MYAPALPDQDRSLLRRTRTRQEHRPGTWREATGGEIARLRHLQRVAGNAAVSRLLRSRTGARPAGVSLVQRCGAVPCGCPAEEQVAHALRDSLGDASDPVPMLGEAPVQRLAVSPLQRDDTSDDEQAQAASQPAEPAAQTDVAGATGSGGTGQVESAAPSGGDAGAATHDGGSGAPTDDGTAATQPAATGQPGAAATDAGDSGGAQVDPVGEITGEGRPKDVEVFGGVSLQGRTNGHFSSSFRTGGTQTTAATDCSGCGGNSCVHVTGTLTSTFSMTTSVSLPQVPSGLSACATRRVRYAIQQCLAPHEQRHVAAFNTYRGTSSQPFDLTTCRSSLQGELQALHDAVEGPRQAAAQAASDALDPYQVDIDLDCEDGERDPSAGVTCP